MSSLIINPFRFAAAGGVGAATATMAHYPKSGSAPAGWLVCDGTAVSRTTYSDLYDAIGTTFGVGDGSTTFNLPDAGDSFVMGAGGTYSTADTGGADTVVLTTTTMAAHSHYSTAKSYGTASNAAAIYGTNWSRPSGSFSSSSSGSGTAHENLHPYVGINLVIKT